MNGKCLCGSVHFELAEKMMDAYYCHCRDCQILSGSAFRVLGIVPSDTIKTTKGETSEYTHQTVSGFEMVRHHCAECATPLFINSTRFPGIQMFMVSALNKPAKVNPSFQIWCTSKISWSNISKELASFPYGAVD